MERLTKKEKYGIDIICENCPYHGICADTSDCLSVVSEKLFAYEDTGLTPERCAELAASDRDGRVVVLPCKAGDLLSKLEKLQNSAAEDIETYTTGYRNGHRNGQAELIRYIFGIGDGSVSEAEAALKEQEAQK